MDILTRFPVRKSKQQKQLFRDEVTAYLKSFGYSVAVESGSFGSCNVVVGDSENANYLITAHYDTCARLLFPNFITPCNGIIYIFQQLGMWLGILLISIFVGVSSGLLLGGDVGPLIGGLTVFALLGLMLFGPANPSNVNDNDSGVFTLLEIARSLPENQRKKVCFVLFDLEESGLIGSSCYRKNHKAATDRQLVLNLDCVGDGDHILMIPTKKLKKDRKQLTSLYKACGYFGKKSVLVKEKGFCVYPSDQRCFPYGVGICALQEGKMGLFLSRIHTPKDTVLDYTNVNILRAAIISFISCNAVN